MRAGNAIFLIHLLLFIVNNAIGQELSAFCSRLYHSVVVANNKVYVDGGELRTVHSQESLCESFATAIDSYRQTYLSSFQTMFKYLIFRSPSAIRTPRSGSTFQKTLLVQIATLRH